MTDAKDGQIRDAVARLVVCAYHGDCEVTQ